MRSHAGLCAAFCFGTCLCHPGEAFTAGTRVLSLCVLEKVCPCFLLLLLTLDNYIDCCCQRFRAGTVRTCPAVCVSLAICMECRAIHASLPNGTRMYIVPLVCLHSCMALTLAVWSKWPHHCQSRSGYLEPEPLGPLEWIAGKPLGARVIAREGNR